MNEQISILIPVFNREKYIAEAIESLLRQTRKHLKIIVYDDGSQDRTCEEVEKYEGVILLKGDQNRGVSYARNVLLDYCDTRYACWQDSDDISNIHRIEEQYKVIRQSGAPLVFCNWLFFSGSLGNVWTKAVGVNPDDGSRCIGGGLFDLDQVGDIRFVEDIDLGGEDFVWLEAIKKRIGTPVLLPKTLYYVRRHAQRLSNLKRNANNRIRKKRSDAIYEQEMAKLK